MCDIIFSIEIVHKFNAHDTCKTRASFAHLGATSRLRVTVGWELTDHFGPLSCMLWAGQCLSGKNLHD